MRTRGRALVRRTRTRGMVLARRTRRRGASLARRIRTRGARGIGEEDKVDPLMLLKKSNKYFFQRCCPLVLVYFIIIWLPTPCSLLCRPSCARIAYIAVKSIVQLVVPSTTTLSFIKTL